MFALSKVKSSKELWIDVGLGFYLGTKNFQICEGGQINVSLISGAGRLSGQAAHLRDIEMIVCPFCRMG